MMIARDHLLLHERDSALSTNMFFIVWNGSMLSVGRLN